MGGPGRRGRAWWMASLTALVTLLCVTCFCASPVSARPGDAPVSTPTPIASASTRAVNSDSRQGAPATATLAGSARRIEFRQLTIEDGLSQSTINCIVQDSRGFMWFGTQDGLNRYDGYDFRVYEHDRDDPHSLSANWIQHCYRDQQDRLWFVTEDAVLHRYDPALDRFDRYPLDVEDPHRQGPANIRTLFGDSMGRLWIGTYGGGLVEYDPGADRLVYYRDDLDDPSRESGHDNKVYTVYQDSAGTLWFGTGEGLVRYDEQAGSFVRYPYQTSADDPPDPYALRSPFVSNIYEDSAGRFWIGTTFGGLHELDRETGRFTAYPYSAEEPNTFSGNTVRALLEDQEGKLWVASGEYRLDNTYERLGLERLDPETGRIVRFAADLDDPCELSHNAVLSMYEDKQGTLWFHTFAGGVDLYNRQTGCFTHYAHDPDNPRTLSDDSITTFYEDDSGGIWLGTGAGGISFYHPTWTRFPAYALDAGPPERESNNMVLRFHAPAAAIGADGHAQHLWVSTGAGLNRWDRGTGTFTFYQIDPQLPDIVTYALYQDATGSLWLGTDMGLYKAVPAAGGALQFTLVLPRTAAGVGLVTAIVPDREGDDLWLGVYRVGLVRFDPEAGEVIRTYEPDPSDPDSLGDNVIGGIFPGPGGTLWIITGSGLDLFDPVEGTFVHHQHDPDNPQSLSDARLLWVYEGQDGFVWVGTNGDGLQRLDPATGTWSNYREEDGLPNDVVYAILPELRTREPASSTDSAPSGDEALWLSTNNGLSRFNPHTKTFRNYTYLDGLQSNEFNWQAAYRAPDGEMFFGGVDGINAFYPSRIWDDPYAPPVYVTGLLLANQPATVGKGAVLQRSVEVADLATLSYRDRVVSFEFAALYYAMPERVQYAYRLEGFDEDWIPAGGRRFVTYTSLPPRDYVFRVKAANPDGVWNNVGASLTITVAPPVWATWWFRGLAVALVVGAVAAGYRFRVRSVEARAHTLERQVASRTEELSALNALSLVVSASLDLEEILAGALDKTLDVTCREAGGIYLLQRDGVDPDQRESLKLVAHKGIDASLLAAIDDLAVGEGFSGRVVQTGEPLFVPDLSADGRLTRTAVKDRGYRGLAIAPLISRGKVLGSLFVMSTTCLSQPEQNVELLTSIAGQVAVAVENARLYADTQSRLAQITALQETSTAVASTLELDELLHLITQQATALFEADGGVLNLVDWDRNEDEAVACVGSAAAGLGFRTSLDRGLSGWIALHNQPAIASDLKGDERVDQAGLASLEVALDRTIRNAAGVPLVIKGQVMGSLVLIDKQGGQGTFDHNDLALLVSFANQAATAIENARLFEAEQRRAEQFRVISEVGRRITSFLDLDSVLNEVVSLVQRSFGYDHVGIALIEDGYAVYKVGAGEIWQQPNFQFRPERLKIGEEGITGWVAAHGRPLLVPDVTVEPRYIWMEGSRTRSELALPLTVKDRVIGVLDVQSNQPDAFDESDIVVLQSLADQAAVAIENARLFVAEQRRAEQFRVISEVGTHVASILTVEGLLEQMARLIQEAFDYYLVEIGLVEASDLVFMTRASRAGEGPFESFRLPVDKGSVTGWVAATGKPLLVPEVGQEPRYVQVTATETCSEMAVAMKAQEKIIGVINVESDRRDGFDASDLSVLQSLANQAAIAIENARLYEQAQRLAVLEERQRLARELHDAVTQTLFSASLIAEAVPDLWENDQQEGRALLAELRQLSRGALAEMRTLLLELRPAALVEANLRDLLRQLGEAVAGRAGVPVTVTVDDLCPLPEAVHVALYRIAQEALNNVIKHAQASQVTVWLRCLDDGQHGQDRDLDGLAIELAINDDGRGFDPAQVPPERLGLGIIRERAQAISATLEIDSHPGQGTRIRVVWKEKR
jgi:GAF domain-containing protein/ligand-binding sensor domain-containing protein